LCVVLAASVAGISLAAAASAAHPRTATAYRGKARSLCTEAKRAAAALPTPKYGETAVLIKNWQSVITIEETEIAALKRLTPPASLVPLVRKGLADKKQQIAVIKHALAKMQAGTPPLQAAFLIAAAPDDSRVWAKIGVAVCEY
jgi:hypothetical protein